MDLEHLQLNKSAQIWINVYWKIISDSQWTLAMPFLFDLQGEKSIAFGRKKRQGKVDDLPRDLLFDTVEPNWELKNNIKTFLHAETTDSIKRAAAVNHFD